MAKDPAVLFYTADFLVGTYGFSMQERGEYITLLCLQHQQGHLSEVTFRSIASSAAVIDKFLRDPHGRYYNERLDEEKLKRENFNKKQYLNGIKGGRPKKPKQNPRVLSGLTQTKPKRNPGENENINNPITKALSNTTDMSIAKDIPNTIFPFSNTTTTTTTTTTVDDKNAHASKKNVENIEEERDEDGLTSRECAIIMAFFDRETDSDIASSDLMLDFIAYNKSKEWRGIGGEDVRRDLKRYLRRWIDEERAKKSKYQRS